MELPAGSLHKTATLRLSETPTVQLLLLRDMNRLGLGLRLNTGSPPYLTAQWVAIGQQQKRAVELGC